MNKNYSLKFLQALICCEYIFVNCFNNSNKLLIDRYIFKKYHFFAALLILKVLEPNLQPSKLRAFLALQLSKQSPNATHLESPCSSKIYNMITSRYTYICNTNILASEKFLQLSLVGIVGERSNKNLPISFVPHCLS